MVRIPLKAVPWFFAGLAFSIAGCLADRLQPALFAVAAISFAVSIIIARRWRAPRQ